MKRKINSVEVVVTWSDGEERVFHYSTYFYPNLPKLFGRLRREVWAYIAPANSKS